MSALALTAGFARWPVLGCSLIAGTTAWQALDAVSVPQLDSAVAFSLMDLLAVCALGAAALCLVGGRGRTPGHPAARWALVALLGLVVASVAAGTAAYGLQMAGNEARAEYVHVLCAAAYVAAVRPRQPFTLVLVRVWTALASVFTVAAVVSWARHGIGNNSTLVLVDGQLTGTRPVDSAAALVVAEAAVMLLCLKVGRPAMRFPVAVTFLAAAVLMQHRTVWIAAAVMVTGLLLLCRAAARDKALSVGFAAVAAGGTTVLLALASDSSTVRNLGESASDSRTWEWRVYGWIQLLDRFRTVGDWLLGHPFGAGYARLMEYGVVDVEPHNYYLQTLLRVGLLGLCALLVLVAAGLRYSDRAQPEGLLNWLLALGLLCYFASYAPFIVQGLLLGLIVRGTPAGDTAILSPTRRPARPVIRPSRITADSSVTHRPPPFPTPHDTTVCLRGGAESA